MSTTKENECVQPYLVFGGNCEEAIRYYQKAIGAKLEMLMRFKECPDACGCPANWEDKIMHASLRIGDTVLMASDGCWEEKTTGFQGFSLSLSAPDESTANRRFDALLQDGKVIMPLDKTFFAKRFGMVADRFGVSWMIIVPAEEPIARRDLQTANT